MSNNRIHLLISMVFLPSVGGLFAELFPERVTEESEFVDIRLHIAIVQRSEVLHIVEWAEDESDPSVYVPSLTPLVLRTSGMSPAFEYEGPRIIRLYEDSDADLFADEPFVEARLPGVSGTYLMILTRGDSHGERSVFFLNLTNIASDPGTLTIFNATVADLESEVASGDREEALKISSGLTQGIPIANSGTVSFLFTFRGGSKQYVFSRKFSRSPHEHLILILVPPLIPGSRDLMGHWVKVHARDLR